MIRFASFSFTPLLFAVPALSQTVVNSTGNTLQSNTVSVEYAIGEITITTLNTNQAQFTQGLLQPLLLMEGCKLLDLVPNAFTPNGDSRNDCFGLPNGKNVSAFELSIYNRWGQLVFKTTKPDECWNGQFNGVQQPTGVYVYMIKATTPSCGPVVRKGTVTLIR